MLIEVEKKPITEQGVGEPTMPQPQLPPFEPPIPGQWDVACPVYNVSTLEHMYAKPGPTPPNVAPPPYETPTRQPVAPSEKSPKIDQYYNPSPVVYSARTQTSNRSWCLFSYLRGCSSNDKAPELPRDPPPASFARQPAPHFPYTGGFQPIFLPANGAHLDDGFPLLPPPSSTQPHPFATHDVTAEDWTRFLVDIQKASVLSRNQRTKASVLPMALDMGPGGILPHHEMKRKLRSQKIGYAAELVDLWNLQFFNPRQLRVILMRGAKQMSGRNQPLPNWHTQSPHSLHRTHSSASSSSSSSSSSTPTLPSNEATNQGIADRRQLRDERRDMRKRQKRERCELRLKRREMKQARRAEKKAERAQNRLDRHDQTFRLVVVPL